MNVLSLFDGISCGQLALRKAGIKYDKYYAAEINKNAVKVTMSNFPETIQFGDVRNVDTSKFPKIDMVIGGSPCQDFSIANKERKGLAGEKSSLFYEFVRILKEVKPKYFLLENVIMEKSQEAIISKELGTFPVRINSKLVSAQLRDRLYWTNIGPETFDMFGNRYCAIPQPKDKGIMLQDILERGYADRNKARSVMESEGRPLKTVSKIYKRYLEIGMINVVFKGKETFLRIKEATKAGFVDIGNNKGLDLTLPNSKTRRGRHMKDKSNCLTKTNQYFIFQDGDIRYLTRTELERLQTVPEGYTNVVSRNHAAALLGDGWTVDVIAHIFSFIN